MSERERPPTLADVARMAGVSVPTASRALNGGVRGNLSGSPELRIRILEAARTLGYSVSTAAQTTKGGRARTIAVLVGDIDDVGAATVISGVMHAAELRGLSVAVRATHDDPLREVEILRQLDGERHRAVLVATGRTTDASREAALEEQLRLLEERGARIVIVGDNALDFPTVSVDNRTAARQLAHGLIEAGHREFALLSAPEEDITGGDRVAGFLEGLSDHGMTVDDSRIVHRAFSRDGGFEGVVQLAPFIAGLDVIAAMSDAMAVGAIARLRELDVDSPRDVEVTGFDHVPMLGDVLPRFSTVEVPLDEFGGAALALALDHRAPRSARVTLRATPIVHGVPVGPPSPPAQL